MNLYKTKKHKPVSIEDRIAEEQAAKQFPLPPPPWGMATKWTGIDVHNGIRKGYAACLTERAMPAEKREAEALAIIQTLVDVLHRAEHAPKCHHWEQEIDGEAGSGPWDTAFKNGPCTCGRDAVMQLILEKYGIAPTEK